MTFEEALEEVFEERASSLSAEGKRLLRDLFEQGVLLGREQERTEMAKHLPIAKLAETVPENPWVQAVHALFRKGVVLLPGDNGEAIVSTQEWERRISGDLERLARALDGGLDLLEERDSPRLDGLSLRRLTHYTDHVWLFPHGEQPDIRCPVQVFVESVAQWMGDEARITEVGSYDPILVVVLALGRGERSEVAAMYRSRPKPTPLG